MYPVLKKGTRLRGFIDKNHRIRPYMENAYGKFELERGLFYELLDADGTEPFKPPYNDPQILADLKKYGLIETPRFMRVGRETLFILINLNKKFKHRSIFKVLNMFLPIVSASIFVLGVCQPGKKTCMLEMSAACRFSFSLVCVRSFYMKRDTYWQLFQLARKSTI